MALPGTHIRFALDVMNRMRIGDIDHYLSGTVYPDSRWVTETDRERTHGEPYLKRDFPDSDFKLGWHVHCLCDHVQSGLYKTLLPDLRTLEPDRRWTRITAAKMIQDRKDIRHIDLDRYLACLVHAETPNGEDVAAIRSFYSILRETYAVPRQQPISLERYRILWIRIGLAPDRAELVMQETERMLLETGLTERIEAAYDDLVALSLDRLPPSS